LSLLKAKLHAFMREFGIDLLIAENVLTIPMHLPLGFDVALMDGYLSTTALETVRAVLTSAQRREQMVTTNFAVAARHFSYAVLRNQLNACLGGLLGDRWQPLTRGPARPPPLTRSARKPLEILYEHFPCTSCPARHESVA
jgi:hypothetical protein